MAADGRRLGARVYVALKAATRRFVDGAFGQQKLAEAATRVDQTVLSNYCSTSPAHAKRFMPIDVLLDLVDASGDISLLKFLADQAGCLLVPLPHGDGNAVLSERSSRTAEEFGMLMSQILAALADRCLNEAEAKTILGTIRALMLDLAGMAEAVKEATVEDQP